MRIYISHVFVDDQDRAHRFCTGVSGFLTKDDVPVGASAVEDVTTEFQRLQSLGVKFTQEPVDLGPVATAVFDDTCGNLIQLAARK